MARESMSPGEIPNLQPGDLIQQVYQNGKSLWFLILWTHFNPGSILIRVFDLERLTQDSFQFQNKEDLTKAFTQVNHISLLHHPCVSNGCVI